MPYKDPIRALEARREWRKKNRNKLRLLARAVNAKPEVRERKRKWSAANRQRLNASALIWYHKHREECLVRTRLWQKANPERVRITHAAAMNARRARKRQATGVHTAAQWFARVEFWGWRCRYCRVELDAFSLTKDHMIPLSKGGSEWPSNLVPACQQCNQHKRCRNFKQFMEQLRVLGL